MKIIEMTMLDTFFLIIHLKKHFIKEKTFFNAF